MFPKQTVLCDESIFIAADESLEIKAKVTNYADNLPVPIETKLAIHFDVEGAPRDPDRIEEVHNEILFKRCSNSLDEK